MLAALEWRQGDDFSSYDDDDERTIESARTAGAIALGRVRVASTSCSARARACVNIIARYAFQSASAVHKHANVDERRRCRLLRRSSTRADRLGGAKRGQRRLRLAAAHADDAARRRVNADKRRSRTAQTAATAARRRRQSAAVRRLSQFDAASEANEASGGGRRLAASDALFQEFADRL